MSPTAIHSVISMAGELTTENYYFPMAGRNFMVAVNVKL